VIGEGIKGNIGMGKEKRKMDPLVKPEDDKNRGRN